MNTIQEVLDVLTALNYATGEFLAAFTICEDGSGGYYHMGESCATFYIDVSQEDIRETVCDWFFEGYE